jgi:serine/threonine protein kinase
MTENNNKNVIKCYKSKETKECFLMVMDYCNTDLQKLLSKHFRNGMPEELVHLIMKSIINGFSALHEKFIIHRDLKLENIFVKFPDNISPNEMNESEKLDFFKRSTYLIGDLGVAKPLKSQTDITDTFTGSPMTMGKNA